MKVTYVKYKEQPRFITKVINIILVRSVLNSMLYVLSQKRNKDSFSDIANFKK